MDKRSFFCLLALISFLIPIILPVFVASVVFLLIVFSSFLVALWFLLLSLSSLCLRPITYTFSILFFLTQSKSFSITLTLIYLRWLLIDLYCIALDRFNNNFDYLYYSVLKTVKQLKEKLQSRNSRMLLIFVSTFNYYYLLFRRHHVR